MKPTTAAAMLVAALVGVPGVVAPVLADAIRHAEEVRAATERQPATPDRDRTGTQDRAGFRGVHPNPRTPRRNRGPGPGWTHAQVRRRAKKLRNQARNRRAHRA